MSGWDWDGDWELLLCAPALSGGISALWSSVEQNCHMRNKKVAEDYGDGGVQISEKSFDGKKCLEEVLGSECSMKCSVGSWYVAVHVPGWVWLGLASERTGGAGRKRLSEGTLSLRQLPGRRL